MTNTRLRKLTLILVLLVVALSASACLHKQLVYRSFDLENFESQRMSNEDIPYSGQAIFITNRIGNITVIGKDNPGFAVVGQYVSIEATISVRDVPFEEIELNWEVDEDEIIIEAVAPEDIGKRFKWTPPFIEDKMAFFDITISVPRDAEVHIEQKLGSVTIDGLGTSESPTQTEIQQFLGEVTVRQSYFETLNIEQENGEIYVLSSKLHRADVKNGLGNIGIQFDREDSVRLEARTGLREITLTGVSDGDPGVLALMESSWPGQELRLQQWDGDANISLETRIGNILVEFIPAISPPNDEPE